MNYIEQLLNDFEDDFGPSATAQESRPMFANGQLVQPNNDGSRPGYKGDKTYPFQRPDGKPDYRLGLDEKTGKYFRKVGKEDNVRIITQQEGESLEDFKNKKPDRIKDASNKNIKLRNSIDNWTKNWLDNNLSKYKVKDFERMTSQLKKDWKTQSKKLNLPKNTTSITTSSGFPNLSTSKGKESTISKNPFSYDNVTFYTPENPSGVDKYKAQWKKIFYKNKIETTPGLKDNINKYFDFINSDKRGAAGGQTIESFKNILDKDVLYLLSEKDSGLQKGSKFEVFNSFDDLAKPYNEFTAKINKSEGWKVNANLIEKELGLKKNSIKNSMVREQKVAAKFFGLDDLKGTGLEYSMEHGQGLSAAARSGNKDLMKTALNDLIGTTRIQNTTAGFGGFEATRGALIRDIEAGVNVKDNVASLNKLTKDAYKDLGVKSNIYSIKDGKLASKPITTATTQADRFSQYAETIYKDPKGKTAINKKFGSLDNVLNTIDKSDQIRLAKIGCPGKANGGRIGFDQGLNVTACATKGVEKLKGDPGKLTPGDQANVRALAKSGKAVKFLKGALGPAAILGEVLFEGGAAANKFMDQGMPIKQALGESYINKYLLGPKTQIDVEAERAKEFAKGEEYAMAERGRRMAPFMPQSATADKNRLRDRMNAEGILTIQDAKNELKNIGDYYGQGYTPYGLNKLYEDAGMQNPGFGIEKVGPRTGKYNEEKGLQDYLNSMKMQKIADAGGVANMAGGGIAKEAGDRSGPAPQSGPNSQGLQGLFNRVKKI